MALYRCVLFLAIVAPGITLPDTTTPRRRLPMDTRMFEIRMKGAHPSSPDAHLCSSYSSDQWLVGEAEYIVKFEVLAGDTAAHHIALYGCDGEPARNTDVWKCPGVCQQGASEVFLFAWAQGVPSTPLPDDVGFRVGGGSAIKTIVLQTHFQHAFNESAPKDFSGIRIFITPERQKYAAGIYLLESIRFAIPPNTPNAHVDVSCTYQEPQPIYPFAYRTHSHGLGKVIAGYMFNNTWHAVGRGNQQWPQAFYPVNGSYIVKFGDELVARCSYDSRGRDSVTNKGPKDSDEMCQFYLMYYTPSSVEMSQGHCRANQHPGRVQDLPAVSEVPLSQAPGLDVPLSPTPGLDVTLSQAPALDVPLSPAPGLDVPLPQAPALDVPLSPAPTLDGRTREEQNHQQQSTKSASEKSTVKTVTPVVPPHPLVMDASWPSDHLALGQVVGVATDRDGNVYIFHRGSRTWTAGTFDRDNKMLAPTPIQEDVILVLNRQGKLIRKFGRNQFYLPHGIEVDSRGNLWVTDAGLHQVMRIPRGGTVPDLVLGERLVPGDDTGHFCQPSDVAVLESGDFYVADGFCNGRIVKYSSNGTFLTQWGRPSDTDDGGKCCCGEELPGVFNMVSSITVAEDRGLVCVADCMHGRVQCFHLDGRFSFIISSEEMGPYVLATEYCPLHGGVLFVVNGHTSGDQKATVHGVTVAIDTGEVMQQWNVPDGLQNPHDVTVDSADHAVYVGELDPHKVWRLSMDSRKETARVVIPDKGKENHVTLVVVAVLITLPVVCVITGLIVSRFMESGTLSCFRGRKSFNMLGTSHQGFTLLSSEDDDFCTGED